MVLNGDDEQEIIADLVDDAVRKTMDLATPTRSDNGVQASG